ncbi:DUF418 domain-containing protein [Viridibacillus sp. YIM B01967]|uniref:DUF418 domain-containing protein n=1 Tax=Viridibacillus soli TaxID=2798301 RepID=A0ABS1H2B3_9BACL|nr:DUF418 domain-containing protein [Viridibacillus soli]
MLKMERIEIVDYLRGFALLGITFVNVFQNVTPISTDLYHYIHDFIRNVMETKFIYMFLFLFGLSSTLFMSGLKTKGEKVNLIYIRRLVVLFLLGGLLTCIGVTSGGLFMMYAVLGLIGFLFQYMPPIINILVFSSISILTWFTRGIYMIAEDPITIHIVSLVNLLSMFSMVILGMFLGQISFFYNIKRFKGMLITCLMIFGFLTYQYYESRNDLESLVMSLFFIICFTILSMSSTIRNTLSFLTAYGRMSMSNFVIHTSFIYFYLNGYKNEQLSSLTLLLISFIIIVLQIFYSNIWLKSFKMGPLEWIWRLGTYGKKMKNIQE